MATSDIAPPVNVPTSMATPQRNEIDLFDLLIIVAKRKWLILSVAFAFGIVAALLTLLLPNRYLATASILPPQQTQSSASMLMSQLAGSGVASLASLAGQDLGLKNPANLYVGMLKTRTIEEALIARFELQHVYGDKKLSDARKHLEAYSEITAGKDGLIDIAFEDKDPNRAAAVANAYVGELRNLTQHLAVTEASQRRLFFEQQLQQAKDDLTTAELALKETQQQTGIIQLDSQAKAIIEAVGRLRGQTAAKEVELQAMRSFATDRNPDVILAEQQLVGLRAQLAKLEKQQSDSGDPIVSTAKIPAVALDYVRRLRDVKYREQVFEIMAKQFEAAKLDEAKQSAIVQVVDPAVTPDKKSSPKRGIIVVIAFLVGLSGALIYVLAAFVVTRCDDHLKVKAAELREQFAWRS